MIPFHGTPISGPETQAAKFLRRRHALVAYLYQQHLPIVADVCASFILDNSAFTAWQKGIKIDFADVIRWYYRWVLHPGLAWVLIPDVIDGDEAANDALLAAFPNDLPGVPVWHMHESIARFERLAARYRTVAIGSSGLYKSPNSKLWWGRMTELLDHVCDLEGRPPCKLHGLRMMDPRIFTRIPFASVDSVNVGVNVASKQRFGMYVPPSTSVRAEMIADRIEAFNSPPIWSMI